MSELYGAHKRAYTDSSDRPQHRPIHIILPTGHLQDNISQPTSPAPTSAKMAVSSPQYQRTDPSGFEAHILGLLSIISEAPSPSYPFPASVSPPSLPLRPYGGQKTSIEEAIERGILALGERLSQAETPKYSPSPAADTPSLLRHPSPSPASTNLLTPEWSTPSGQESPAGQLPPVCSSCSREMGPDGTPTKASIGQRGILPKIATGVTTSESLPSALPSATSGGWAGDSGMSAEKELELLKAQVQDIARVCKVSIAISQ